jgi:methanogenic corrinoid protein MtbC1
MTEQEQKSRIISLSDRDAQQERAVNDLILYMVNLDIGCFEEVLDTYIHRMGVDKAINQIVLPFLHRIGILWMTNHIHPAQEHLVSNIIRQKLIVGIEGVMTPIRVEKTVLLFLPEGEHHEIGLLYLYYLLKIRGVRVLYLGANVPLKDVEFVCKFKKPDYLYSHMTAIACNFNFEKFLTQVRQDIPGIPLVISGQLARTPLRKIPPGIDLRRSLSEVLAFIATL